MGLADRIGQLWRAAESETKGFENLTELLTRIAFFVSGGWILAIAWIDSSRAPFFADFSITAILLVAVGLGILEIGVAVQGWVPSRKLVFLIPLSIVYLTVAHYWIFVHIILTYGTDGMALNQYSAILVLRGQNPYTSDLSPALVLFPVPETVLTPRETGEIVTSQTYPALSFLLYVPFVAAGVADMRIVSLGAHVLSIFLLFRVTRGPLNVFAPLAVSFLDVLDFTPAPLQDILWIPPIVLSVATLNRPRWSGLLYGIACSIKPVPWLIAPYLFVYLWKREGTKLPTSPRLWNFVAFSAASFLAFNGPFLVANPGAWASGVLSPLIANNVPQGTGVSTLMQAAWIPVSRTFFSVMAITAAVVLLTIEIVDFEKARYILWWFPAIVMFLSYRSFQNYFIYWYPLVFMSLASWFMERIGGRPRGEAT